VILEDVQTHLQGEYGIRRYLGDSYWHPDYRAKMQSEKRAADYSSNRAERDAGGRLGGEAQWCIFDPIISVIYGERYLELRQTGAGAEADEMLRLQTVYFNRALNQLTGKSKSCAEFLCPEAYCLENGHYVPNDQTPLLWTQANLWLALHQMQKSLAASGRPKPS
jgi:phosphorylase kinase alpha/beta subunit